jgi:glycosyltransferase involved in cell wall biosynthesis
LIFNGGYGATPSIVEIFRKQDRVKTINYLPGNDLIQANIKIFRKSVKLKKKDIFHILSPMEPQSHSVIHQPKSGCCVVSTIYDFIPYLFQEQYLPSKQELEHYLERLELLRSCVYFFAISEQTKMDAIEILQVPADRILNIGIAPSDSFYSFQEIEKAQSKKDLHRLGIPSKFILSVSNLDPRKNLVRLIEAYCQLPTLIRDEYSLLLVSNTPVMLLATNSELGKLLEKDEASNIQILYSISDSLLNSLYNNCSLFIMASLYEGGGLPIIEAQRCGAPVIASNSSSLPEYIGNASGLFDPRDVTEISSKMEEVLMDKDLSDKLREDGKVYSTHFKWKSIVSKVKEAYIDLIES